MHGQAKKRVIPKPIRKEIQKKETKKGMRKSNYKAFFLRMPRPSLTKQTQDQV
jgi:hypothetical protein